MRLVLSATGVDSGVDLFRLEVDGSGQWSYQSRAVELATGTLSEADQAQLHSFFDRIDWELEVLNMPISFDDRTRFKLEVSPDKGDRRVYQFSEAINHASWQFRDLVHFLRHNVATKGDPVGRGPDEVREQPPAAQW